MCFLLLCNSISSRTFAIGVGSVEPSSGAGLNFPDIASRVTPTPEKMITVLLPANAGVKRNLSLNPPCMNQGGFRLHPYQADCDGFLRMTLAAGPISLLYNSGRTDASFFGAKGVTHTFGHYLEKVNATKFYFYTPTDRIELVKLTDGSLKFVNSLYGANLFSPKAGGYTYQTEDQTAVFTTSSDTTQYWISKLITQLTETTYTYQTTPAQGVYPELSNQPLEIKIKDLTNKNPDKTISFSLTTGNSRFVTIAETPEKEGEDSRRLVGIFDEGLAKIKTANESQVLEITSQDNSQGRSFPVQTVTRVENKVVGVTYYGLDNAGHLSFLQSGDEWANVSYAPGTGVHYVTYKDRYQRWISWRGFRAVGDLLLPVTNGTPFGPAVTTYSNTFPHDVTAVSDPRYGTTTVTKSANAATVKVTGPDGNFVESVKSGAKTTVTDNFGRKVEVTKATVSDGQKQTIVATIGEVIVTSVAKIFNSGSVDVKTTATAETKPIVDQKLVVDQGSTTAEDLIRGTTFVRTLTPKTSSDPAMSVSTLKQGGLVIFKNDVTQTATGYNSRSSGEGGVVWGKATVVIDRAQKRRVLSTVLSDPVYYGPVSQTVIDDNGVTANKVWLTRSCGVALNEGTKKSTWASMSSWINLVTRQSKASSCVDEQQELSASAAPTGDYSCRNRVTAEPPFWLTTGCGTACGGNPSQSWGACCYDRTSNACSNADGGSYLFTCNPPNVLDGTNGSSKCTLDERGACKLSLACTASGVSCVNTEECCNGKTCSEAVDGFKYCGATRPPVCGALSSTCTAASQCCSSFCSAGRCATPTTTTTTTRPLGCGALSSKCTAASQCCSNFCSAGKCATPTCKTSGQTCSSAGGFVCCPGFLCNGSTCVLPNSCKGSGQSCGGTSGSCCSGLNCNAGTCGGSNCRDSCTFNDPFCCPGESCTATPAHPNGFCR